jgi:hypothetical protein
MMKTDEKTMQAIVRFGCLYLAAELCKTANAFDRPQRVLALAKEFEAHCTGEAGRGRAR